MIDGLKLTMTGVQLIEKLNARIRFHETCARQNAKLLKGPAADRDDSIPEHVLERDIDQSHDRIEVLTLIRDHLLPDEVYRLGEFDLRFADLLPEDDWFDCGHVGRLSSVAGSSDSSGGAASTAR